ncbi:MAG: hypothetical protein EPO22_00255, partial [Dehalococcoidia bacterium]
MKRGRAPLLAAVVATVAVASGVACDKGGGGKSETPTSAVPTSTATTVPEARPTITGNQLNYPAHGFAAAIPDGWHANPGGIVAGLTKIDTFFSAATVDGVQANISVTCEGDPAGVTTEDFVTNRLATITKRSATDLMRLDPMTVAGQQAQVASYTITRDQLVVRQYDVMFVTPKCAWTIELATAPSAEN